MTSGYTQEQLNQILITDPAYYNQLMQEQYNTESESQDEEAQKAQEAAQKAAEESARQAERERLLRESVTKETQDIVTPQLIELEQYAPVSGQPDTSSKSYKESIKDINTKLEMLDKAREVEESYRKAGVKLPDETQEQIDRIKEATLGKSAPFVKLTGERVQTGEVGSFPFDKKFAGVTWPVYRDQETGEMVLDFKAAIMAGIDPKDIAKVTGLSLAKVMGAKKKLEALDRWQKIDVKILRMQSEALTKYEKEMADFSKDNVQLPDETWISKDSLEQIKQDSGRAYDLITKYGYKAYTDAYNEAYQLMQRYYDKRTEGYDLRDAINDIRQDSFTQREEVIASLELLFTEESLQKAIMSDPRIYEMMPYTNDPWAKTRNLPPESPPEHEPQQFTSSGKLLAAAGIVAGPAAAEPTPAGELIVLGLIASAAIAAGVSGEVIDWKDEFNKITGREPTKNEVSNYNSLLNNLKYTPVAKFDVSEYESTQPPAFPGDTSTIGKLPSAVTFPGEIGYKLSPYIVEPLTPPKPLPSHTGGAEYGKKLSPYIVDPIDTARVPNIAVSEAVVNAKTAEKELEDAIIQIYPKVMTTEETSAYLPATVPKTVKALQALDAAVGEAYASRQIDERQLRKYQDARETYLAKQGVVLSSISEYASGLQYPGLLQEETRNIIRNALVTGQIPIYGTEREIKETIDRIVTTEGNKLKAATSEAKRQTLLKQRWPSVKQRWIDEMNRVAGNKTTDKAIQDLKQFYDDHTETKEWQTATELERDGIEAAYNDYLTRLRTLDTIYDATRATSGMQSLTPLRMPLEISGLSLLATQTAAQAAQQAAVNAYEQALDKGMTQAQAMEQAQAVAQATTTAAVNTMTKTGVLTKTSTLTKAAVNTAVNTLVNSTLADRAATRTSETTAESITESEMANTATITTTGIPKPPKLLPPNKQSTDKEKRAYILQQPNAVAWPQGQIKAGKVYHVVTYDNDGKNSAHMTVIGRAPEGTKMYRGPREAYKSITQISGKPPARPVTVEGGAVDPTVYKKPDGRPGIGFIKDSRYRPSRRKSTTRESIVAPDVVDVFHGRRRRRRRVRR